MMTSQQNPFLKYLEPVRNYLRRQRWDDVPVMQGQSFTVSPLAGGEYNLNYLLESAARRLVFRVNMASQINRDDQIEYEFKALQLLQHSGVTPVPFFVDDSRRLLDRGISIMEYLPGRPLDYNVDLTAAAKTLAVIHQLEPAGANNLLIVETKPLSLLYTECAGLLDTYCNSELADDALSSLLLEIKAWAASARAQEQYFLDDPWFCIVNTEVNSGNFIVNRERQTTHLIDWEMPRWGDPSTDLCHFCSPLTTLWKTDFRFSPGSLDAFLREYKNYIHCDRLRDTLEQRMQHKMPFVLLRGISWSAMAWVQYQSGYQGIRNEDTWQKIQQYMQVDFIRSLFEPFMNS